MRMFGHLKAYPYGYAWVLLVIIAGYVAYHAAAPAKLNFADLASPKGFRTLLLKGNSSAFDPFQGLLQDTETANSTHRPAQDVGGICERLLRDPSSPTIGSRNNTVSVVEFFDYRCPYCKVLTRSLSSIRADGLIHVIYKEWPILGQGSLLGARAALAAGKQGKYLEFHEALMRSRLIPTMEYIQHLSSKVDLNQEQLVKDMFSEETSSALRRNSALASSLGLVGTPVLVVGRTFVQGAVTQKQLEQLIAYERSSGPLC